MVPIPASTPSNLHLAFHKADLPAALIRDLNQFLVVFSLHSSQTGVIKHELLMIDLLTVIDAAVSRAPRWHEPSRDPEHRRTWP
jgi:hypothetical protein